MQIENSHQDFIRIIFTDEFEPEASASLLGVRGKRNLPCVPPIASTSCGEDVVHPKPRQKINPRQSVHWARDAAAGEYGSSSSPSTHHFNWWRGQAPSPCVGYLMLCSSVRQRRPRLATLGLCALWWLFALTLVALSRRRLLMRRTLTAQKELVNATNRRSSPPLKSESNSENAKQQ